MPQSVHDRHWNAAPRHQVKLGSWVMAAAVGTGKASGEAFSFLRAQIHDVSLTGIALFIARDEIGGLFQLGDTLKLRLTFPVARNPFELEVEPVRFELLIEADPRSVLVGSRVTETNTINRQRYFDYIGDVERMNIA